jgi:hypothetical protein
MKGTARVLRVSFCAFEQAPKFAGRSGALAFDRVMDGALHVGITMAADLGEEAHADLAVLAVDNVIVPVDQSISLKRPKVMQVSNRAANAFGYVVAGHRLVLRRLPLAGAVPPHALGWCHGFIEDRRSCHLI